MLKLKILIKLVLEKFVGWLLIIASLILLIMLFDSRNISVSKNIVMIFGYFTTFYSWMKVCHDYFREDLSNWDKSLHAMLYAILLEVIIGLGLILSHNKKWIIMVTNFSQSYKLWALNIILILLPLGVSRILKK